MAIWDAELTDSLSRKYEKCKQLSLEVKENESKLLEKLEMAQQQIKAQEQRYDKLKNHALFQLEGWVLTAGIVLEIVVLNELFLLRRANAKLETLTRTHANDLKKLQAQLKKEEISRQSLNEQLAQKSKENEELVKICDELINQGPDGS